MPIPMEYHHAGRDFEAFMADLIEISMLQTRHQAYTMLQAVLQVFRRRLTLPQAIAFADLLPPVVRAIFVSDWDTAEPRRPFADRDTLMAEVRLLRHNHNLSTPTAIEDVTAAIRRHVDDARLEAVLRQLPDGALAFWGFRA
ncbi:Uncharacterized conserved protein, DUF2267 family [Rhizobium sp. RU35A]|uniref:DUF2267 domain-containing protein n=1 Tax=Rhizobium sp. RU35A TaxID=1907414 RepID=UPI000956999D|nr:DUF2267 domain-containing protein [Rhizobium sp. RU35A]SIQ76384.1 Uncharacterized conserved protein, DUF2267 family [Rhizobium sp. RU35A]